MRVGDGVMKERMGRRARAGTDERAMLQDLAEAITQQLAKGRSPKRVVGDLARLGFSEGDARRLVRTVVHGMPQPSRARPAAPCPAAPRAIAAPAASARPGMRRLVTGLLLSASGGTIAYACVHAAQPAYYLVIPGVAVVAGMVESVLGLRATASPA